MTRGAWGATAGAWVANHQVSRVQLAPGVLSSSTGARTSTVYLVVGTDRRAGQPRSLPALGSLTGERADSISLWVVHADGGLATVALPRDLRVHLIGHGDCKLGATLEFGAEALVQAVHSVTGLPVHHYVEVTFEGFARLVDAVGGVDIVSPAPLRDRTTGLDIPAGTVRLDAVTALRYVRARSGQTLRSGRWVAAGTGDVQRIDRQQRLVAALIDTLRRAGSLTLAKVALAVRSGVVVDDRLGSRDLGRAATAVTGSGHRHAAMCVLPSRRELVDAQAMSPFPPAHDGSTVFRLPDAEAAAVLLWVATPTPATSGPRPSGCRGGGA
jgi:LCP family protein required for cell wall assembly